MYSEEDGECRCRKRNFSFVLTYINKNERFSLRGSFLIYLMHAVVAGWREKRAKIQKRTKRVDVMRLILIHSESGIVNDSSEILTYSSVKISIAGLKHDISSIQQSV